MSRKPRECPNPNIQQDDITKVVKDFKCGRAWSDIICSLAHATHAVTPKMVCFLGSLLQSFLTIGLNNCVLPVGKIESAIAITMYENEKIPQTYCMDRWVSDVTEHIRLAFSMLRLLKIEDITASKTPGGRRRYPKTNSFRRQASGADTVMIASLTDQVSLKGLDDVASDAASTVSMRGRESDWAATADETVGPSLPDSRSTLLNHFKDLFSKPICQEDVKMKGGALEQSPSLGSLGDDEKSENDAEDEEEDVYDKFGVFVSSSKGNSFIADRTQARKAAVMEVADRNQTWTPSYAFPTPPS